MKIKYIVLFVLILGISLSAKAHDFLSVNDNGDTIYYNITSSTSPLTVSVTFNNSAGYSNGYTGDISIPDSVVNIGNSAFRGCSLIFFRKRAAGGKIISLCIICRLCQKHLRMWKSALYHQRQSVLHLASSPQQVGFGGVFP